jgi:hypothetical protein
MSKVNLLIANLLILLFFFGLNSSQISAEPCPPECPVTTSTTTGTVNCNLDWKIKWDSSNPQEVSPGNNVTLKFGEGNRPYTVSVTGNDFWLDQAHKVTTINNNYTGTITLYAGNNSCGSAEIIIKDRCDNEKAGYVRSTSGTWGSWSNLKTWTICGMFKWGHTPSDEICEDVAFQYHGSYGGGWWDDYPECSRECLTIETDSGHCSFTACPQLEARTLGVLTIRERKWVCNN